MGSDEGERVATLTELAADAFRTIRIGDPVGDGPLWAGPIDVLVSHRPAAGTKALVEIRKVLGLKYATVITDLNQRFGCLAIRPRSPELAVARRGSWCAEVEGPDLR